MTTTPAKSQLREVSRAEVDDFHISLLSGTQPIENATFIAQNMVKIMMSAVTELDSVPASDFDGVDRERKRAKDTVEYARFWEAAYRINYPHLANLLKEAAGACHRTIGRVYASKYSEASREFRKPRLDAVTVIAKNPTSGLIKIMWAPRVTFGSSSALSEIDPKLEKLAVIDGKYHNLLCKHFSGLKVFGDWFADDGRIAAFALSPLPTKPVRRRPSATKTRSQK